MQTAFCTVLAANYVAAARTLGHSLRAQHPHIVIYALFVDDFTLVLRDDEPFLAVPVAELNICGIEQYQFKYDIVEFSTCVKPKWFEYLFATRSIDSLIYLDPDIFVAGKFDAVIDRLRNYDILLTPHFQSDFPPDSPGVDATIALRFGLYNLGFIAMRKSENALRFLSWWWSKLDSNCTRDDTLGYFVDQKVMDLVPLLFEGVFVDKSAGLNVAYWNIHERRLHRVEGGWKCNGEQLVFFHFSDFDPHRPDCLRRSVACPDSDGNEDLPQLVSLYAERLLANGYDKTRGLAYGRGLFSNGEPVLSATRRYYRGLPSDVRSHSPFDSATLLRRNRLEYLRNRSAALRRRVRIFVSPVRRVFARILGLG